MIVMLLKKVSFTLNISILLFKTTVKVQNFRLTAEQTQKKQRRFLLSKQSLLKFDGFLDFNLTCLVIKYKPPLQLSALVAKLYLLDKQNQTLYDSLLNTISNWYTIKIHLRSKYTHFFIFPCLFLNLLMFLFYFYLFLI